MVARCATHGLPRAIQRVTGWKSLLVLFERAEMILASRSIMISARVSPGIDGAGSNNSREDLGAVRGRRFESV